MLSKNLGALASFYGSSKNRPYINRLKMENIKYKYYMWNSIQG